MSDQQSRPGCCYFCGEHVAMSMTMPGGDLGDLGCSVNITPGAAGGNSMMVLAHNRCTPMWKASEKDKADRKATEAIFPLAWAINDHLEIDGDRVTFTGSQNDVEAFRDLMHKLDPNFVRGCDGR